MKYICQLIDGEKIQNASYHNLDARYMRGKAEPQTLNSGKYVSQGTYEYFKNCLKRDDELFWYFVIRFLAATGARVSDQGGTHQAGAFGLIFEGRQTPTNIHTQGSAE